MHHILIIKIKDHQNYLEDHDHEGDDVQGEGGVVGSEVQPRSGKPLCRKPSQVGRTLQLPVGGANKVGGANIK